MNIASCAASLFALLVVSDLSFAQAPQSRTDHLLYTIPPGWKRVEKDQYTVLTPANLPAGKMAEIRIVPMRPLAGSLDGNVQAEYAYLRNKYANVQPTPVNTARHRNGFDMAVGGASMETAAGSNHFLYAVIYFARADDQVQPIYFVTDDQPLYMSLRPQLGGFVESMRLSDLIVLAAGKPPLTQSRVDQTVDFLEWMMEVPFTEDQKRTVTSFMVDSWKKNDRTEIDGVGEVLKVRAQLSAMTKEQKELARQAVRSEAMKQWRSETDAVAKLMVGIYDTAHQPIANGDPPLTRQGADAMLEVLFFMACQVNGQTERTPTREMKDLWAKNLTDGYAKLNVEARQGIAQMPMAWAALRVAWPEASDAEKAQLRAQWSQSAEVKMIASELARVQQQAAPAAGPKDANELSQKLTSDYQTTRTLMNISMQMHQSRMYTALNMGGSRYEYRYR